jgi:mannose-6-phosphate isomerase-like protein (cupin superfamily)
MKRETSFGTLEVLLEKDGEVVCEHLCFKRSGRSHQHEKTEVCQIVNGSGIIVIGDEQVVVKKGDMCTIPPNVDHYMIPNEENMEIVIVYK